MLTTLLNEKETCNYTLHQGIHCPPQKQSSEDDDLTHRLGLIPLISTIIQTLLIYQEHQNYRIKFLPPL